MINRMSKGLQCPRKVEFLFGRNCAATSPWVGDSDFCCEVMPAIGISETKFPRKFE